MRRNLGLLLLSGLLVVLPETAAAEAAEPLVAITLKDGSRLVGRVVAEDAASVTVVTADGVRAQLPRHSILSTTDAEVAERPAAVDPNYSRLMFAPTGRPLRKGDGYFSDYELLFPGLAYGITDNFSLAGGLSVIPGLGLHEQLFYISPKLGFQIGDRAAVAVGGLFAGLGAGDDAPLETATIGFAVGTMGGVRRSVTLGLGIGGTSESRDVAPILMAGGTVPLSRKTALVGETWVLLGDDFDWSEQPFGLALRFFGGTLSADVGIVLVGEMLDEGFPMPWLSVTYHFGKAQDARAAAGPRPAPAPWRTRR